MRTYVFTRTEKPLLITVVAFLVTISCVEKHIRDTPALDLNQTEHQDKGKFDLDRIVEGLQGFWVEECGPTDTQRVTWSYSDSRYTQKIEIYLDRSCPESSLAAVFEIEGSYNLGEINTYSKDSLELDYVRDSYSLTIIHKSYQDAYNAVREFRDLPSFCENFWFEQGQKVNLIGKSCLDENNRYSNVQPILKLFTSIKLTDGKLLTAKYNQIFDGSSAENRALLAKDAAVYSKISMPKQIKISEK